MKQMFKTMPNSPITRITANIAADATTIPILESDKLPTGPNIATLGVGATSETIIYTTNSNGMLTGVTRGVEGTKREWPKGTEIARFYTAYDHNTFIENILGIGIVDSGSTSNGSYIKYGDGTMECYVSELTLKHTDNSNYRDAFWYFPATFAEKPAVFMSHRTPFISNYVRDIPPLRTVSNTINATRIIQNAPDNKTFPKDDYFTVSVMAKGRWK